MTPLVYVLRTRLSGAHEELGKADPTRGDTVSAIAARWGFPHAARFATYYREEYGCTPHHTLRS